MARRAAAAPPARAGRGAVAEIERQAREGRPVIFVGLDGADWQLLDPLMADGRDAATSPGSWREGAGGALETSHPPLSPLVWTTMMTGVSPLEHRILDFTRFRPATGQKEPITSDERRAPAVWNMAGVRRPDERRPSACGRPIPAERVNGLLVSDRLFTASSTRRRSRRRASSSPPSARRGPARRCARRRRATGFAALRALPALARTEDEYAALEGETKADPYAHPVTALRRILVETRGLPPPRHRVDRAARSPTSPIVYLQGTDSDRPRLRARSRRRASPTVSEEDFERYSGVPERYFRHVDDAPRRATARSRRRAGAVLVLASDHGFIWGEGRPTRLSSFAHATAGKWHRKEGIYLLRGPGIAAAAAATRTAPASTQVVRDAAGALGPAAAAWAGGAAAAGARARGGTAVDYAAPLPPAAPARGRERREPTPRRSRSCGRSATSAPARRHAAPARGAPRDRRARAGSYNNEGARAARPRASARPRSRRSRRRSSSTRTSPRRSGT